MSEIPNLLLISPGKLPFVHVPQYGLGPRAQCRSLLSAGESHSSHLGVILADRAGEPALSLGGRPAGLPQAGSADPGRACGKTQTQVSPGVL